jgi:hypothetical protein
MSITTHAQLITAVSNWLKRDDLTSYITDFITLAEAKINREFILMQPPLRALEQTATGTIATETLALPTGYLGIKRLSLSIGGRDRVLEYKSDLQSSFYDHEGQPVYYTTRGGNIVFAPQPGGSFDYELVYFKKLDALSAGSNWTIENAPDLYLYGTLLQATPFIKDDKRLPIWGAMYAGILTEIEQANLKDRTSGSTLAIRSRNAV